MSIIRPHEIRVDHEIGSVVFVLDQTTVLHITPSVASDIGKSMIKHASLAHRKMQLRNKYIGLKGHN